MNDSSHGFERELLTRRQLLEFTAQGLLVCGGLGLSGLGGATIANALTPGGIHERVNIDGLAPSVRGEMVQVNAPPPNPIPEIIPGDLILGGDRNGDKIYNITMDDGPDSHSEIEMANIMRDHGMEGLIDWFFVANNALVNPQVVRQLDGRGYPIQNHSLTHASYNPNVIGPRIALAQDIFFSIISKYPRYFRSPGLTEGHAIQSALASLGMANVFTTGNINDWISPRIFPKEIITNFINTLHPGYIALMHSPNNHQHTIQALPFIISEARARGYEAVSLDTLVANGNLQRRATAYNQLKAELQQDTFEKFQTEPEVSDELLDGAKIVVSLKTKLEAKRNLDENQKEALQQAIANAEEALQAA